MMKENIVLANESLNRWCNTNGINYYEGIEALGNLFKWAVPKIKGRARMHFGCNPVSVSVFEEVSNGKGSPIYYETRMDNQEDPALTLFWAIYKAARLEL